MTTEVQLTERELALIAAVHKRFPMTPEQYSSFGDSSTTELLHTIRLLTVNRDVPNESV